MNHVSIRDDRHERRAQPAAQLDGCSLTPPASTEPTWLFSMKERGHTATLVLRMPNRTAPELTGQRQWRHDLLPVLLDLEQRALIKRGPIRKCRVTGEQLPTWWPLGTI